MDFATYLKDHGIKQATIARDLQVDRSHLHHVLKGHRVLGQRHWQALALRYPDAVSTFPEDVQARLIGKEAINGNSN